MIVIEAYRGRAVDDHPVEIVERKGIGHPDYICDSIMEDISVQLSRAYMKEFGMVLHHNIDKGLLAAGRTIKRFGGGRVIRPIELIIGDRATFRVGQREIPVMDIAINTAKEWFKKNLRFVDPEKDIRYRIVLAEGSEELMNIFSRREKIMGANDTSAAVGYYPFSATEDVVLKLERFLNSRSFKKRFPETGEDVKVMAVRKGNALDVTVAMPLLSRYIHSEDEYFSHKEVIIQQMNNFLDGFRGSSFRDIKVHYNTLDTRGRGLGGIYLSLIGTSAEDADSGQVGRGNRVNGLISMNRPMGTEAAAGKNPVSHVGKIYNVLAHKIAQEIYEATEGIKEVYVLLLSRIGTPINEPQMATAQILLKRGKRIEDVKKVAEDILKRGLDNIGKFCIELAKGRHPVC